MFSILFFIAVLTPLYEPRPVPLLHAKGQLKSSPAVAGEVQVVGKYK